MSTLDTLTQLINDFEAQAAQHESEAEEAARKKAQHESKATAAREQADRLREVLRAEQPEPEPEPEPARAREPPVAEWDSLEQKQCKVVGGRFVCLNCKDGGGPKVGASGYANYGAWYNHCYGHRTTAETNCKFNA